MTPSISRLPRAAQAAAERRHDAGRHRRLEAERVADRDRELTDARRERAVDGQVRHAAPSRAPRSTARARGRSPDRRRSRCASASRPSRCARGCVFALDDDVAVRHHVAVGRDDEARARARRCRAWPPTSRLTTAGPAFSTTPITAREYASSSSASSAAGDGFDRRAHALLPSVTSTSCRSPPRDERELHRLARAIAERACAARRDRSIATPSSSTRMSPTSTPAVAAGPPSSTLATSAPPRDRIRADAEVAAADAAVLLQLVDDAAQRHGRNREVGAAQQRPRVHADHRAIGVDQRTAGEPARDLPIALDVAIELAAPRRLDLGAEHADRAQRRARGAAGTADREREVADRRAPSRLAELRRRQAAALDPEQRDVGPGIAADDLGVALVEACRRRCRCLPSCGQGCESST